MNIKKIIRNVQKKVWPDHIEIKVNVWNDPDSQEKPKEANND